MPLRPQILLAASVAAALFSAAARADQLDDIKKKGEIVFGVLGTDEPNSFVDPKADKLFVKWYGPATKLQFDKRSFKIDSDAI